MGEQPCVPLMIRERTDDIDRRTVLRASGVVLTGSIVGLAGCAEPEEDEPADPADPDEDGVGGDETPAGQTPTPEAEGQ